MIARARVALGRQANHLDRNKANNAATNLEWSTPRENMLHRYATQAVAS